MGERARAVARGDGEAFFSDVEVAGRHVRVYTLPVNQRGYALQVARPLDEVDAALSRIRQLLLLIALGGIGLAGALGLAVARGVLAPVRRLTVAAEEVSETRDLSRRIDETCLLYTSDAADE